MIMATRKKATLEEVLKPRRSAKAGRPPEYAAVPRVRRRQKTAHAAVKKGDDAPGRRRPRVPWGVTKPKVKQR
jgi:hypothetical protein